MHLKADPFICSWSGCEKTFADARNMQTHVSSVVRECLTVVSICPEIEPQGNVCLHLIYKNLRSLVSGRKEAHVEMESREEATDAVTR